MTATYQDQVRFVTGLAGKAVSLEQNLKDNETRARIVEEQIGVGLDATREDLREAMNFSVKRKDGKGEVQSIDERGQRESIETGDVASSYLSLDQDRAVKVQRALEQVLAKAKVMSEAKSGRKDGKGADIMLFTATQIIDELYVPLIRERLLPDNLLTDDKSPTARMLNAVFKSYQDMLRRQKEERELQLSQAESNYHNAGTRTERLQSVGVKVGAFVEGQLAAVASKTKMTPDEVKRVGQMLGKGAKLGGEVLKSYTEGKSLDRKLKGVQAVKLSDMLENVAPPDLRLQNITGRLGDKLLDLGVPAGPLNDVLGSVAEQLYKLGWSLDEMVEKGGDQVLTVLRKFAKLIESDGVAITMDVVTVLVEGVGGGLEIAGTAGLRYQAGLEVDIAVRKAELRSGVRDLGRHLEGHLSKALLPHTAPVARAVSGGFAKAYPEVALYKLIEPALGVDPPTAPQMEEVVGLISAALRQALLQAHEKFDGVAADFADAYRTRCSGEISRLGPMLRKGELADPANCLLPLAGRVTEAAEVVFSGQAFLDLLDDEEASQGLLETARQLDQAEQEEAFEQAEQEMDDFERQLVLMDEGGLDSARQQSLDKMIAQLKSDQLDLDIVLKAGSLFAGVGGSLTKLGTDSANVALGQSVVEQGLGNVTKTVATQVQQSMLPALEAAQLVMKMTVTVIKISRRATLASKFKADVQKARNAGSYLLPSIENFYDAKVQQQVFAGIELALQFVQLAGSVCATVPEPITMAVGRALNAAAKAGEAARDLGQTVYNDKQLKKGWEVTLQAINNPGNRRMGLDALYHNSTLAVHSVAWAATNGDVLAQEILRSCKVDAQTLADEGTNKDKVVQYLETLLSEDLQFKDENKINLDWAPKPLVLSYPGWFTLKGRARKANPPLGDDATDSIDTRLRQIDNLTPLHTMLAHPEQQQLQAVQNNLETSKKLVEALKAWEPKATDRSAHAGMISCRDQFVELAEGRVRDLKNLVAQLQ